MCKSVAKKLFLSLALYAITVPCFSQGAINAQEQLIYDQNTQRVTENPQAFPGGLLSLNGMLPFITFADDNQLYVPEMISGRIYKVDPVTGDTSVALRMFNTPHHIIFEPGDITQALVIEALGDQVIRVNMVSGERENAFPGVSFITPHRIARIENTDDYLVTELPTSTISKVSFNWDTYAWEKSVFSNAMIHPDPVVQMPDGNIIAGSYFAAGKLAKFDVDTGEIYEDILNGFVITASNLLLNPYKPDSYIVSENLGNRISIISKKILPFGYSTYLFEKLIPFNGPTGLTIGTDPVTQHKMLYAVEFLGGKIVKYDMDDNFSATVLTKIPLLF